MYEVRAYHCSYCKKYGLTKAWIKKHEERCFHNPVTRSCCTCANFQKSTSKEGIISIDIPICLEAIPLSDDNTKWKLKSNCSKWVERPDDEEILMLYQDEKVKNINKENKHHYLSITDIPF